MGLHGSWMEFKGYAWNLEGSEGIQWNLMRSEWNLKDLMGYDDPMGTIQKGDILWQWAVKGIQH